MVGGRWGWGEGWRLGRWHLLGGDQTAALKHAELIPIVSTYLSQCDITHG